MSDRLGTRPLFDLTGRTALITGSSRGIGCALAQGLLEAGARVVVHGRDHARVEATAARRRSAIGHRRLLTQIAERRRLGT